jgi:hypothetical protein
MSHFTEIKTQIKDIEALRLAVQELGLTLLQNAEARGYYENKTKGDYVIQLKGPYDIALNKQADGSFALTADLWQGHVEKEVGQNYGKLLQLYGVHKATIEGRKKGLWSAVPMCTALTCLQDRLPSAGATRRVQPLQLQEVVPSSYCRVWYSILGLESEAKLQTRVMFLFMIF